MTWPGGQGGQHGQGDDQTQRRQGLYPQQFGQDEPTQRYQGSYPSSPYEQTRQQPVPGPYQPGWEPGWEQPYQQQAHPGPPPGWQPPPHKPDRTGLWVALTALALVVTLGVVVGVILLTRDGDDPIAGPTSTPAAPTSERPTSERPTSTEPAPTSAGAPALDPVIPGWQVVVSTKRKLAYDVPPGWEVLDEDTIIGFEDAEGPQVGMSGAAQVGNGFCAESETAYRAGTGLSGYRDTDLELVAEDAAGKWGRFGYLGPEDEPPSVDVVPAEPATIAGGDGMRTRATVSEIVESPCVPPSAVVHTAAIPSPAGGSFVLVIISDQGVPDAVTDEQADQIISSLRFFPG